MRKDKKKMLDIGCGPGTIGNIGYYKSVEKEYQIYGSDMLKENISLIKKRYSDGMFSVGNAEKLPFPDEYFDAVVMRHVLEHVVDLEKTIREVKRITKKEAIVTAAVPHKNLEFVLKHFIPHYLDEEHHHQRIFTQKQLEKLFVDNHFTILVSSQEKWPMFVVTVFLAFLSRITGNVTMQEQSGVFLLKKKNYLQNKSFYSLYSVLYRFFSFLNRFVFFFNYAIPFEVLVVAKKKI